MDLKSLIDGNDSMQRLVASERRKEALHLVAPEARDAIRQEIVPQIEELITGVDRLDELVTEIRNQIEAGFKTKDTTYTRLIRYKSIDQSDQQYERDLVESLGDWARNTRELLMDGKEPGDEDKQEVKVKVEIDGADAVETSTPDNLSEKAQNTEDVEVALEPPFELNDVRL